MWLARVRLHHPAPLRCQWFWLAQRERPSQCWPAMVLQSKNQEQRLLRGRSWEVPPSVAAASLSVPMQLMIAQNH